MANRKNKFIHKPVYPGGPKALQEFLRQALRYPEAAKALRISGKVRVEYSLNQQGRVIRAKAVKGPEHGCREEAERLVKMLRFDIPKDYKMTVQYHQHIDINFEMKKPASRQKPTAPTQIHYEVTPKRKDPQASTNKSQDGPPKPSTVSYTYTIKL